MKTATSKEVIPTVAGTPFAGGFYVGRFFIGADAYALILAPRADGDLEPQPWSKATKKVTGALSYNDGAANTAAMVKAGSALARIPPHKSLFAQPSHLGLPIGNLSSQFFANVYLDVLDQHVKHALRAQHYIRYVDDFLLLHESPQQLNAWRAEIFAFLPAALSVTLNPAKTILQPIARGIDFVGQVIKPWRRTLRRRTFNDALARTAAAAPADVWTSANSYFGLLRQATASHHDRARLANLVRRRGHTVDGALTKAYQ